MFILLRLFRSTKLAVVYAIGKIISSELDFSKALLVYGMIFYDLELSEPLPPTYL